MVVFSCSDFTIRARTLGRRSFSRGQFRSSSRQPVKMWLYQTYAKYFLCWEPSNNVPPPPLPSGFFANYHVIVPKSEPGYDNRIFLYQLHHFLNLYLQFGRGFRITCLAMTNLLLGSSLPGDGGSSGCSGSGGGGGGEGGGSNSSSSSSDSG